MTAAAEIDAEIDAALGISADNPDSAAALAPKTVKDYRHWLRRLRRSQGPLGGIDADKLLAWLRELDDAELAPASIQLGASAVARAAKRGGIGALGTQPLSIPAVADLLAAISRTRQHRRLGSPDGLRWEDADRIAAAAAAEGTPVGLRDAALIATMSDALLRRSEAAALDVRDIRRQPDGTAVAHIRRSKTDQLSRGTSQHLTSTTAARIDAWLQAAGIAADADAPLWQRQGRTGGRVDADLIGRIVRRRARAVGITGRITGHSLRRGAAQSLVAAGATLPETMDAGRWSSAEMVARYARDELARTSAVARLRTVQPAEPAQPADRANAALPQHRERH